MNSGHYCDAQTVPSGASHGFFEAHGQSPESHTKRVLSIRPVSHKADGTLSTERPLSRRVLPSGFWAISTAGDTVRPPAGAVCGGTSLSLQQVVLTGTHLVLSDRI